MKSKLIHSSLFLTFFSFFIIRNIFAQAAASTFPDEKVIPLLGVDPQHDNKDFEPLKKILIDKEVIGLGEATHGTRDFFQAKHRMIQFLVTELNYKVLVFEAPFPEVEGTNDYIMYGKGDVYQAVRSLNFGVWFTEEVLEMIEWLKQYNSDKPVEQRVRIYGCDLNAPQMAASKIKTMLEEENLLTASCAGGLDWMIKRPTRMKYPKEEKKIIKNLLKDLELAFQKLPVPENEEEKKTFYCKRILEQSANLMLSSSNRRSSLKRDRYMAENTLFIKELEGDNKMMLWAHNGHIAKKSGNELLTPQGRHLYKALGNKYYAIGFGFNSGEFMAVNMETNRFEAMKVGSALEGSSDYYFSTSQHPVFFIDFSQIEKGTPLSDFVNKKTHSRYVGARFMPGASKRSYRVHKLINSYDGLIFVRETSASVPLDRSLLKLP